MLKKYKQSGIALSVTQLKEIKGGMTNSDESFFGIKCNVASDCGSTYCVEANSFMWTCDDRRCTMYFCEGPGTGNSQYALPQIHRPAQ